MLIHPQRASKEEYIADKKERKLTNTQRKGFISTVEVKSMTHYFLMKKREDIHMVYNGTSILRNEVLWPPNL